MSNALFVFATGFELTETLDSLVISPQGDIVEDYKRRSLDELKSLKKNCLLYWVLPSTLIKPHVVSLPTLKKFENTIPFLLEESLADDLSHLHFVLDKRPLADEQYLVYICHKSKLQTLTTDLKKHDLAIDVLTSDFIRDDGEAIFYTRDYAIIHSNTEPAAISYSLLTHYQDNFEKEFKAYVFTDSPGHIKETNHIDNLEEVPCSYPIYLAEQFIEKKPINLLQGALKPSSSQSKFLPTLSISVCSLGLLTLVANLATQYVISNQKLHTLTGKTTAIYKKFFPNAQAVISPRFRIEQKLKESQNDSTSDQFFSLINTIHHTFKSVSNVHVDSLKYNNSELLIRLHAKTFDTLDKLKLNIETQGVTVSQLSATSKGAYVNASWRVK